MTTRVPPALRARFGDRLKVDESLAAHVSFRIGGPADLLISAREPTEIVEAIEAAEAVGIPWLVLGRGSNVLIDDAGVRGLVIRNDTTRIELDTESGLVRCDSGVRLPSVGVQTAKAGLAGFEWAVGIPGSVGGGVVMNAGAHGGCIADCLIAAEVVQRGRREQWTPPRLEHGYRTSRLQSQRDVVVLGAEFQLRACPPAEALARIQEFRQHRQDTQPTDAGAGSIFRNPPECPAGRLIDEAGLKGTRRGGALISPKHGNFIVNVGSASSADVLALIELAREVVYTRFGVLLHPEVEIIGPDGQRRSQPTHAATD